MKRILVALSLILLAFGASAETILLSPTAGSGSTKVFYNIPNDAGLSLTLYAQPNYVTQNLVVNGTSFTGPNKSPAILKDAAGDAVTLTTSYTSYTKCSGGHPVCYTYWTLHGVSIVR